MCADELNLKKRKCWTLNNMGRRGLNEIGRRADTKEIVIRIDPRLF